MMLLKLITSALRDLETWGRSVLFGVSSLDLCYKRKGWSRTKVRSKDIVDRSLRVIWLVSSLGSFDIPPIFHQQISKTIDL